MRQSATRAKKPTIIIINGAPGTGKTTLSRTLSTALQLPVVNRDTVKKIFFDTIGWHDRLWSKKVGVASYRILYYVIELLLQAKQSFIAESNFDAQYDTPAFTRFQEIYPYHFVQILCSTDTPVLLARLQTRNTSGERHADRSEIAALTPDQLIGSIEPLQISGTLLSVDTTDSNTMNINALISGIAL